MRVIHWQKIFEQQPMVSMSPLAIDTPGRFALGFLTNRREGERRDGRVHGTKQIRRAG